MSMRRRQRVLVVVGTRPEAIKLAPVVRVLRSRPEEFDCLTVSTGQHGQMVSQALEAFGIKPDVKLEAMASARSLGQLTGRLFKDLDDLFASLSPEWVLVQGDTTSAMVGAVCGFYQRIRVGHVEAGLRTHDRWSPFPEEVNRTFVTRVADLHFAPTERAADNLRAERVPEELIRVTGNTVVDALRWVSERLQEAPPPEIDGELLARLKGRRLVLVTSHRRESFGEGLEKICQAIRELVRRHPDVVVVYPVHLNPNVRGPVHRLLGDDPRIMLLPPLPYLPLVWLMRRSHCIFTDSGGIQEEAPSLGKPVLILRETTERPEAVQAGCARLVGTSTEGIVAAGDQLLSDAELYRAMSEVRNPFGDGRASVRIAEALVGWQPSR